MVDSHKPVPVFIVMGVCGSGKTSIAEELQKLLGCDYVEGDQLHPPANVEKMGAGIPLVDDDRWSWLEKIRDTIIERTEGLYNKKEESSRALVVTCSSLRKVYRDILCQVPTDKTKVTFVYLKGSPELLAERMGARKNHFFGASLLQSQLDTLEEPNAAVENVIVVDIRPEPKVVAANILSQITI
ncbi:shikimate kinase [Halteromyces radiatus]|uniref:shikimate kinase n=1 Tax=Halteromyces radiatus TaxID=101107 RepID=UPI00221E7A96|nr:shikimate kinase [Halteromyces radiatus]KAI8084997.1 shikimate kinase [Halteromyces radiatus]